MTGDGFADTTLSNSKSNLPVFEDFDAGKNNRQNRF